MPRKRFMHPPESSIGHQTVWGRFRLSTVTVAAVIVKGSEAHGFERSGYAGEILFLYLPEKFHRYVDVIRPDKGEMRTARPQAFLSFRKAITDLLREFECDKRPDHYRTINPFIY